MDWESPFWLVLAAPALVMLQWLRREVNALDAPGAAADTPEGADQMGSGTSRQSSA